jgi:hypothetical protein
MIRAILAAAMLSVPFVAGCATILRGTHQTVRIRTEPSEATAIVDGISYTTPAKLSLSRKTAHLVLLEKEGYRSIKFNIDPIWDGVSLVGNIILPGGSAGYVFDAADGADKNFYHLGKIRMMPSTRPDEPPLALTDFKGELLTEGQVEAAEKADRLDRSQFWRGQP